VQYIIFCSSFKIPFVGNSKFERKVPFIEFAKSELRLIIKESSIVIIYIMDVK
jgi:hypothetical protein